MHTRSSEKGQALILIVFAILGLIGLTALAVDGGNAYSNRRQAQNTADASALAAALVKAQNPGGDVISAATASALANNFNNDGVTNTVTVHSPPAAGCDGTSGPYAGNTEYIQVIIESNVETYFGPVVGINEVQNCVEAIARGKPSITSEMVYGNAVVSLAPDGCDRTWAHGTPAINVFGGGVFTNSNDPSCAFRQNGSGSLTAPSITVVGGASYSPGHVTPAPTTGASAAALPYPPPIIWPNPSCSGAAVKTGNTLSAGTVSGDFPPSGVEFLNPGIYCVTGDFRLNGNQELTGSEVLIVMQSGGVTWNGTSEANLSGPTSGPFVGLLLFQPIGNTNTMTINGTADMHLTGSILAPGALIRILGTGAINGFNSQVIGFSVEFGGNSDGTIRYNDEQNYDAAVPPSVELVQ